MEQKIDKYGNLTISLFDILDQQDDAKFIYFYLGLDRRVKKLLKMLFTQLTPKNY